MLQEKERALEQVAVEVEVVEEDVEAVPVISEEVVGELQVEDNMVEVS